MNRLLIWGAGIVLCGVVILPIALSFTLPGRVEKLLIEGLQEAGFENVKAESSKSKSGAVILTGIKLGEDGFSSIEEVRAEYGGIGILLSNRLKNLNLKGLKLVGELNENNSVSIAGWHNPEGLFKKSLVHSDSITFEKANIDLMSQSVGGINLKLDGQIRRKSSGGLAIQGRIAGIQRQLSIGAKLTGDIGKDGNWQTQLEIEEGKINIGPLKAGRISGLSQIFGAGLSLIKTSTQLSAGAVTLYGLPWQNASATIEGDPSTFTVFLEGKSIGEEGVEFGVNFDYANGVQNLEGAIHTEQLPALFDYLREHKALPEDINPPALLSSIHGLSLNFAQSESAAENEKTFLYALQDGNQIVDLKGILKVLPDSKTDITLSASPVRLEKILEQADPKPQHGFTGGVISVSGDYESSTKENKFQIKGNTTARLEDVRYFIGPLSFDSIDGDIVFDDPKSWSSSASTLSFKMPLRSDIDQKGRAQVKIKDGKQITLSNAELGIFGGTIAADPVTLSNNLSSQDLSLLVSGLDMGRAVQALDIQGLHLSGLVAGNLPIVYENGRLSIKNGTVYSADGNIRFRPETLPGFLQGDDMYIETLRLALENYRFTSLDIKIDGPLNGDLKLVIAAQGTNPDIFDSRPVALNFSIVAKPAELIKKIRKP